MIESIILEGMLFRNPAIFQKTQGMCVCARKIRNMFAGENPFLRSVNSLLLLSY
jgi:hypothetical protein